MKTKILLLILLAFKSYANPNDWTILSRVTPSSTPKYFFRPIPNTPYLSYTSGWSNMLINQYTGEEITTWGQIDAIPSPDGLFVAIPTLAPQFWTIPSYGFIPELGHMNFYSTDKIVQEKGSDESIFFTDYKMPGAYQTISILSKKNNEVRYRMVTESMVTKKRLFLQDYVAKLANGKIVSMKKVNPKPKALCPELSISLPMLSKSGKYFAAVNPENRHMRIFEIKKNNKCKLFKDLEMPTGKVDFSFDDKLIAFHVSPVNPQDVAYVVRDQSIENKINIMTYNLKKDKLSWVTKCTSANCYYPSFRKNGSLTYLRQPFDNSEFEFVTLERK